MNWDILGHEWAVDLLKGQLTHHNLRHAYLFTGPQGVGRRTLALRFAQVINCSQPPFPGEACRTCRNCIQTEKAQHPDLTITEAGTAGGILKVEQIRELQHSLSLAPYQAEYRVALLLRFEEANASAANALLKTLEEPAAQVVLLLTADNTDALLPTITSRCEVLRLRPVALETVRTGLQEKWGVSAEEARRLAHLSSGRPGYAYFLFNNPDALVFREERLTEHQKLLFADRVARFDYAEQAAKNKADLRQTLEIWNTYWRDVMLRAAGASESLTNIDRMAEIEALAGRLTPGAAKGVVTRIQTAREQLDRNVNPRLLMENLLLDFP